MEDWETLELELPEEVENTPYEEPKITCEICGQEFTAQGSLSQHKRSCLPGTQVFKELLGGKIEIDEYGFKEFLEKNKWDILIKAWIIDTLKSKHALDTGKISNILNQSKTELCVDNQSYFIPWITTQLYLKFLGKSNFIDNFNGFSENTGKSIEKVNSFLIKKGENIKFDKFPIWNGWRKIFKNIFNLGKFNVMNIEPIRIFVPSTTPKPVKSKLTSEEVEIENRKKELKNEIFKLIKTNNYYAETVEDLVLLKEKILYQFSLYDELKISVPDKIYFDNYYSDFESFKKNIDLHKDFVKKYLMDDDLNLSSFQQIVDNFKKMTPTPYFPIVILLENKLKEFDKTASVKDKKQMLINLRRINNTGQKVKGENLFASIIKFNILKNILDYFEKIWN